MATVQESTRPAGRAERFVQQELARAIRRVRLLDVAKAALGLVIAFMVYGLLMMLADRWLNLSQTFRQLSLLGFAAFAALYTWLVLLGPIRRAVNPYYAALQVEQTIPDAKNSLVNWLDLHDDNLPQGVVSAIGERAAEDLKETDVDQAIRSNSLVWLAGITLGLVVGFAASYIIFRGDQFNSLFGRAFAPFGSNRDIVKQTRISMVTPPDGDLTVATNRKVTITVRVNGRVPAPERPDSMRLLIRYNGDDLSYDKEIPLAASPNDQAEWTVLLGLNDVRTGFWYRVAGGDDQTPEYRVNVRSSPSIERFEVKFTYRRYLRWDPRPSVDPNIEDYRGTDVVLDAVTNRQVRDGRMLLAVPAANGESKSSFIAERVPDRPEVLRFKFALEKDAKYRIWFTTVDDESNNDPLPYTIHVLQDGKPEVEFTKPAELKKPEPESDLALPADGMLRLEGQARDDFGIRSMTLRMMLDGAVLKPKDYLTAKDFRLETGGYMRTVEYKDDVDLRKLVSPTGLAMTPQTGSILEYWLEAVDNSDFPEQPSGQVGSTRHYRVKILPPRVPENAPNDPEQKKEHDAKKEERDKERSDAGKEKQEQEKKHEQDREKQSKEDAKAQQDRKDKQQEQEQKDQAKKNKGAQGQQQKPDDGQKDEQKDANAKQDNAGKGDEGKSETERKIEQIKKELEEQQKKDGANKQDSDAADKGKEPAEPKPAEPMKPDANKGEKPEGNPDKNKQPDNPIGAPNMDEPASPKGSENPGGKAPGDAKNNPQQNAAKPENNEKKDGNSSGDPNAKGENKLQPGGDKNMAEAKDPPKPGDMNPMNPMPGNGAEKDPKANPMDPGAAKGAPDKQQPNDNKAGKPNDAPAQPKENKPGEGGMGEAKKDNDPKGGAPKDNQQKKDGDANKPKDRNATEKGGSKPAEGNPDAAAKPDEPNNPQNGRPDGSDQPGANKKPMGADNNPADGKPMPQDQPGQGAPKPGEGKGDQGAGDKAEKKDDGAGGKDDVSKAAEKMQNGNAQEREAAKQQLEQMAKDKSDPQKQKAAQDALKQAQGEPSASKSDNPMGGDPMGPKPQDTAKAKEQPNKPGEAGDQKPAQKGDPKKGEQSAKAQDPKSPADKKDAADKKDMAGEPKKPGDDAGKPGDAKKGDQPGGEGVAKGEPKGNPKDDKGQDPGAGGGTGEQNPMAAKDPPKPNDQAKPMPGDSGKDPMGQAKGEGGKQSDTKNPDVKPGEPGSGEGKVGPSLGGKQSDEGVVPSNPNEDYKKRSGDLGLDKVDKKKLKELFDKYKLTPEELDKYLKQQAAKKATPPATPDAKDLKPGDRTGGRNLNKDVRRVETPSDKDPGALQAGSSGNAPPEYRKAAAKFAEQMGKEPAKK